MAMAAFTDGDRVVEIDGDGAGYVLRLPCGQERRCADVAAVAQAIAGMAGVAWPCGELYAPAAFKLAFWNAAREAGRVAGG